MEKSSKYIYYHTLIYLLIYYFSSNVFTTAEEDYLQNRDKLEDENKEFCEKISDGTVSCTPVEGVRLFRIPPAQVGETIDVELGLEKPLQMKTVQDKPSLFEIPNFLTMDECDYFIKVAKKTGLKSSQTYRDISSGRGVQLMDTDGDKHLSIQEWILTIENSFDIYLDEEDILKMYKDLGIDSNDDRKTSQQELGLINPEDMMDYMKDLTEKNPVKRSRYSKQVWMFPDSSTDEVFTRIQERVQRLTKLPNVLIKKSDFQVVNYGPHGHYNAHHDSTVLSDKVKCCTRVKSQHCRICRFMTVLFYLNDVEEGGGTAFPIAGNETYDVHVLRQSHKINLQRYCEDAPVVVQPEKGKAVMWYNHFIDDNTGWMGELDNYTWHGGCPVVKGEKWIANFWIKTTDNKNKDLFDLQQIKV